MAKGFDILRVKSAVKVHNKMPLDFTHLTTMDFGQPIPLAAIDCVPADQMNISADFFSRMAPLARPTYGKFSFRTITGFVPYHQIADDADAWISGKTLWEGHATVHRYITVADIVDFCINNSEDQVSGAHDFEVKDGDLVYMYRLNNTGRFYYKVLTALGYTLPENYTKGSAYGQKHLSAYPLLAFFKLYNDYMSQSQRYNSSQLTAFLRDVKHNVANGIGYSNGHISAVGLETLFYDLRLNYGNDYFTSAWQHPNSPVTGSDAIRNITAPVSASGSDNIVSTDDINAIHSVGSSAYGSDLSQRTLDFLRSFDDWVRRNNYSGSRAVQQIYSRFGIKPDDYRSNYAEIISTDVMPVQVGDVTSVADTEGAALGEYAGKGIMNGGKTISYRANDFGMLFIIGYFTVVPMNAFGFDRKVLRIDPLDYYTPEFDGLGADAISAGEYYVDPIAGFQNDSSSDTDVFGFTERYNSYRFSRDVITGDFRLPSMRSDMDVWHTGRLLTDIRKSGELVAQTMAINTLSPVDSEYNRLFGNTSGDVDHFYLTCTFNVNAVRPMKNFNQVVDLGEGDTVVPRNGNVVS